MVRTKETGLGNWVADVLVHAYAESLLEKGSGEKEEGNKGDAKESRRSFTGVDAVIICGGTIRGDSQYGPGKITLGDILGRWSLTNLTLEVANYQRFCHSKTPLSASRRVRYTLAWAII